MIRDIALGQYIPGDSPVHRMDPRVKIVLVFLFIVFLFVAQNFVSLLLLVVSVAACILLSGVPMRHYLKSVKAILFIVLFTSVLNLFYGGGETLLKIGFMEIKSGGVSNAIFIAVRILTLILLSAVLTFTAIEGVESVSIWSGDVMLSAPMRAGDFAAADASGY